jgi:hypothetical protein
MQQHEHAAGAAAHRTAQLAAAGCALALLLLVTWGATRPQLLHLGGRRLLSTTPPRHHDQPAPAPAFSSPTTELFLEALRRDATQLADPAYSARLQRAASTPIRVAVMSSLSWALNAEHLAGCSLGGVRLDCRMAHASAEVCTCGACTWGGGGWLAAQRVAGAAAPCHPCCCQLACAQGADAEAFLDAADALYFHLPTFNATPRAKASPHQLRIAASLESSAYVPAMDDASTMCQYDAEASYRTCAQVPKCVCARAARRVCTPSQLHPPWVPLAVATKAAANAQRCVTRCCLLLAALRPPLA